LLEMDLTAQLGALVYLLRWFGERMTCDIGLMIPASSM
jgi:hypothetical protein